MKKARYQFEFEVYDSIEELPAEDAALLQAAYYAASSAYAPYSNFKVGAAARLRNGEIVTGSNQENASYPAGLCAERVALAAAAAVYPGVSIDVFAVTYQPPSGVSDHPIAPCGICRQSFQEFEERTGSPIKLIIGGKEGDVHVLPNTSVLLPFGFNKNELQPAD